MRNGALYAAGLALGGVNTVRHRMQGYVNPRPFEGADVDRTIEHATGVVDRLERHGAVDWNGLRVLECGPGSDMATGAIMLARGASRYTAVDRFDNRDQASPALYARLAERLDAPVDVDSLGFVRASFPEIPEVDGPFDLIVSNATLEHIENMGDVFASFARCAAPGGRMVHHVDAQTHMRWIKDVDPLNILRYSEGLYRSVLAFPGAPNRLRSGDYERLARATGWEAHTVPGISADAEYLARSRFASRFQHLPGLELLTFTLVATWPGQPT